MRKALSIRRVRGIFQLPAVEGRSGTQVPLIRPERCSAPDVHGAASTPRHAPRWLPPDACQVSPWTRLVPSSNPVKCRPQAKGAEPRVPDPG